LTVEEDVYANVSSKVPLQPYRDKFQIMAMRSSKDFALIDPEAINSEFCSQHASKSLRVTCYGSSSSKTPMRYLKAAETLGYTLAKRGHICVNGAGSHGCMAAMNDGAVIGNGHIVGVIHEMFVVDAYFGDQKIVERDGGAHEALMKSAFKKDEKGPIREILVAGGSDLQERKKMLVQNADALVVLPGRL
jgi:predicted Rossmann-fold nucleotide-binding protein